MVQCLSFVIFQGLCHQRKYLSKKPCLGIVHNLWIMWQTKSICIQSLQFFQLSRGWIQQSTPSCKWKIQSHKSWLNRNSSYIAHAKRNLKIVMCDDPSALQLSLRRTKLIWHITSDDTDFSNTIYVLVLFSVICTYVSMYHLMDVNLEIYSRRVNETIATMCMLCSAG